MLSEIEASKPIARKRVWEQSDSADSGFIDRLLAAAQTADIVPQKGYSAGSLAVANVAAPRANVFDIDLLVSSVQPTTDAMYRYNPTRLRHFRNASDTGSVANWKSLFGPTVKCVGFTPTNASTQRSAWDIYSLVNVESPETRPTIWDQPDAATASGGVINAYYAVVVREAKHISQLDAQAKYLKNLKRGWDGYGAEPLEAKVIDEVTAILKKSLIGINVPAPDLIPGGDGSLQAEWRRKGYKVFFNRESEGQHELYVEDVKTHRRLVFGGADALLKLRDWAKRIAD